MKIHSTLAAIAALCLSFAAFAQDLKPGLWEMSQTTRGGNAEMEKGRAQAQQNMSNMTPEQRKAMEEMMAKHGVKMNPAGPGGPMTITTCMTREMVERHEMPSQRGDCKATRHERSGNKLKVAFTCSKASGEGEYTFTSPEAFTMKMTMHTTIQGKQETMNMEGSGKWLSADCGNVKPMYPSKK
jgi:hypothetical protein